jgi:uncharacterized protein (TIGR02231 family)
MTRLRLAFILLAGTAASPAFADTIAAQSKIDAVTVFPSGAEVTRVATASLAAGDHALVFDGLPGDLDPETIRVEGEARGTVEIGSVDARLVYVSAADADARRRALEAQVQALTDERGALDQTIADAEYQKSLMQQLASGAFATPGKDDATKHPGAAELGQLLDLVGGKLAALSKAVLEARIRQRQIDASIADLGKQMAMLAPQDQARMQVTVHLAAPAAADGTFRLRYRIDGAGWQPVYDARLTSPAGGKASKIELVRRAAVRQSTTEDWTDVALTLSTARPVGATAAPDLVPQLVGGYSAGRVLSQSKKLAAAPEPAPEAAGSAELDAGRNEDVPESKTAKPIEAQLETAGFQALYAIPGRVSIDNTGTAKTVRMATSTLDSKLSIKAVPKLDANAYLTASFMLDGESPMLPGPVMLYRDGVFMGQGSLPLLSPGEEARLGFGADDLVKVKRVEVKRVRGEEGLISTSNTDVRAYDITVRNLHDFAVPVTILDQMPYSTQEDIVVEALSGMTPPTTRDFEKKRGVLAWDFDLDPAAEQVLKHGFKVTWPKTMEVGMTLN